MSALDWDHNAFYHRLLLRQLPDGLRRVLDVGCGAGVFASKLAARAEKVDAVDKSPEMIAAAYDTTPDNVTLLLGDVLKEPLPEAGYDAIVSVTALHHLPLEMALPVLARALRPGGVLVAVALPRTDLPRELPVELLALISQRLFGLTFALLRKFNGGNWFAHEPTHSAMPVLLDPPLATRQVREYAAALLPGAQVRRLVFWRYFLLWHKPSD
ncbi:class I SAM-dependent methyltransferase [Nocardia arthritidis]|uniref:class I SAM-dependent methyltransferase n=1 Tax=Nocardia arthritidis TaxID=228602 RepID=UPI001EEB4195|nr:class I SAM-dependent methyltransferase [Nocardia arthritidis]